MEITAIDGADMRWDAARNYIANCGWDGGPHLANLMAAGFTDWERLFLALDHGRIAGYCTLQKDDYLPDLDYTPYVRFVFVDEAYRGARLSEQLCATAIAYARSLGFDRVYLTTDHVGLYEKYGFTKIGAEPDEEGSLESIFMHLT